MVKKNVCFSFVFIVLLLSMYACNGYTSYPQDIVGTWYTAFDSNRYEVFTFNEDGSGSYTIVVYGKDDLCFSFTYRLEDNVLVRYAGEDEIRHTVKIKGNTLILQSGKSSVVLYKTQQNACAR